MSRMMSVAVLIYMFAFSAIASAQVMIETVTIGNPGNGGELSGTVGSQQDRICGAVDYVYNIAKFEVTAGQYTEFLNAVAATDRYALYDPWMDASYLGCQITQNGTSGSYTYDFSGRPSGTEADWANRPVNYISWGKAVRFVNWLHNGQPTGAQDLSTTEDGSYLLNGATSDDEMRDVVRKPDATWVIPSEDEWYKAAYHYNDGVTSNYYDYPTSSDIAPSNDLIEPDPGNNANFQNGPDDYTIGNPYYRTVGGDFESSGSPYGSFDQGGNIGEWTEADSLTFKRPVRGGSWRGWSSLGNSDMQAASRNLQDYAAWWSQDDNGFRVAKVSPPACGNGLVDAGEECDDGGTDDGDGCSSSCMIEPRFSCTGEPSVCVRNAIPTVSSLGLVALACGLFAVSRKMFGRRVTMEA